MGKMTSKSISLLTLGLVCALGVLGSMRLANRGFETNAATVQTERRLYVYLVGGWDGTDMYIHYWGGEGVTGTTWSNCPQMTRVVSDYWQGLYFYDVPVNTESFLVKNATGDVLKTSNQSDNMLIASLFVSSNYLALAVSAWVSDGTKRAVSTADTLGISSLQIVAVLNNINSCDSSYAEGYNAWPQLNDLFITPSTFDGSTVVPDNYGPDTTITGKCTYLQARYNLDQAS
jgi:hypothetical protein